MTNKQFLQAYSDFLYNYCNCPTDENGNRPCDRGEVNCEKCLTKDAREAWARVLQTYK